MAKPTKAADFRGLTNEEIDKEVYVCRRKLLDCRIAQKTRKVRVVLFVASMWILMWGWGKGRLLRGCMRCSLVTFAAHSVLRI